MPYDNPMNLGMIGMHGSVAAMLAVKKTDLLIAVGARFQTELQTMARTLLITLRLYKLT